MTLLLNILKLVKTDQDPDENELLDTVMNDFDCVCSDYGV